VIPNEAPGNVPWWHLQRAFLDMDDGARGLKRRPLAPNPHPRLNSLRAFCSVTFLNEATRWGVLIVAHQIFLYRIRDQQLEVLLVHPGGPFWAMKDLGSSTIPKGEIAPGEDPFAAACREFEEELGFCAAGQTVAAWHGKPKGRQACSCVGLRRRLQPAALKSNTFTIEWPPHSGRMQEFPEVDRAEFFGMGEAKKKIDEYQAGSGTVINSL